MGNPVFKFTLTHANLGTMVISEPDGWKDAKLKMERHPEFHSLVEYIEGELMFYGENNIDNGGADFIRQVETLFGPDATLEILIEADIDGDGAYEETIFRGLLDLTGLKEVQDNKVFVPIIRNDLWSKFISRKDTPVNLRSTTDLDGNPVAVTEIVDINLTSQKVPMRYYNESTTPGVDEDVNINVIQTGMYYQMSFITSDTEELDSDRLEELEEFYILPQVTNSELPAPWMIPTYGGTYSFDIQAVAYDYNPPYNFGVGEDLSDYLRFYININGVETPFTVAHTLRDTNIDGGVIYRLQLNEQSLNAGDLVRIYGKGIANLTVGGGSYDGQIRWNGKVQGNLSIDNGLVTPTTIKSYARVEGHTTFPSSTAQGFLVHDAAHAIINRICGEGSF